MKKLIVLFMVCCLLLAGCISARAESIVEAVPADNGITETAENTAAADNDVSETDAAEQAEESKILAPLPDTTMENLTDAILSVSLAEGGAYVDDTGKMQMDLKIYSYDKYDMVDVAGLKVGDVIFGHAGTVTVNTIERNDAGSIFINGGLDANGIELVTDEDGIFYERGYNDAKNWYEVGAATIRVSVDFEGIDGADLEKGEVVLYPGSFLIGEVKNYDFTPYNTTVRVENGQIIEMNRVYIP